MPDFFYIKDDIETEVKIKKSQFITHLSYADDFQKARDYISNISKIHKTATHNCWAYIIGKKGETFHSSDNGEPSGTAGKPMLGALQKHGLTNIVAVVTRYFGGTKLGVRGLIEAYAEAVETAVTGAVLYPLVEFRQFSLRTDYNYYEKLKYTLTEKGVEITSTDFEKSIKLILQIEESSADEVYHFLVSLQDAGRITGLANEN
ncbi:MAG: YigZ family protein [Candidatus Cloacimonetes bacterium]|nr:YigZ family protein [Candidatus Cloacimonadota bacterium]